MFYPSALIHCLHISQWQRSLERVTNGEVQAEAVLKALDVIKARFGGLVGRVQGNAHVKAQHQKVEVVAQTGTCAKRNVLDW